MEKTYSTYEAEEITGISAFTIRYYDKCGLFPDLTREVRKSRRFSESDLNRLRLIDALRNSGLSIDGIKYVLVLIKLQDDKELPDIINHQISALDLQIEHLTSCKALLEGLHAEASTK